MIITIPSKGRVNAQLTWKAMPESVREHFHLTVVCEPNEVTPLTKQGIRAVAYRGKGVGIGEKRQWILKHFHEDPILGMFDDDLNVWAVPKGEKPNEKLLKADGKEIYSGLRSFEELMKQYVNGSLGGRSFALNRPHVHVNAPRLVRALAYNLNMMPPTAKFRLPTCEDLDMQLQLLTAGLDVFTYNGLLQEQKGSNLAGGCSEYRDLEFQREQYAKLAAFHPQFVTPVMRTYRRGWEGMDKTQPSVNINWRAAAAFGKRSKA